MNLNFLKKFLICAVMIVSTSVYANEYIIVNDSITICKDSVVTESGQWTATYYGNTYKGARRTANGDKFHMMNMTCAAPKQYKFNSWLLVENVENGKVVVVKVTDRGAFGEQTIDLTYGAFEQIASHREGRVKIKVYMLGDDINKFKKRKQLMLPSGFQDKQD